MNRVEMHIIFWMIRSIDMFLIPMLCAVEYIMRILGSPIN